MPIRLLNLTKFLAASFRLLLAETAETFFRTAEVDYLFIKFICCYYHKFLAEFYQFLLDNFSKCLLGDQLKVRA